MSTGRKKIFLQKKHSLTYNPKESNKTLKHKKSSKGLLTKGPWTLEEDKLLMDWIKQNGAKNWTKCAHFIPGRSGKQCREHWNNSLNTEIVKGNWSSEEDFLIMKFYQKLNGSWKKMIPIFKSRTENSIKNRFYSQLRKIASKYIKTGKKEYSTKFGLETLLKYFDIGMEEAKKRYLKEHPMSDIELEVYIKNIENKVKNKPKGEKFIDLDISDKNNNTKNNKNDNNNKINDEKNITDNHNKINDDKNLNDNNIDINESEDEFNESLKKFSKKDEDLETIKKMKKNEKIEEEEEKKKPVVNQEEWKTHEETFDNTKKDDKDKPKSIEKNNNIEGKNNINTSEKKNEISNYNNDYVSNNNNDKNIYNNNNIINNNIYNIHNTINYNINNNNNSLNNNFYNKNNFGMNNINNISDNNNNNISTNLPNNNYSNSYNNLYSLNSQRNNSNIFKQLNFLTKKSSDLSEHIKNNDHKAIENKYNSNNISNQDVFQLLNNYNNTNYEYPMNQNYTEQNYYMHLQSGKINTLTPSPPFVSDKKFQYPNDYINYNNYNPNYLSKRSESYDFKFIQNLPMNSYGFNKSTSFNSINTFDDGNRKL